MSRRQSSATLLLRLFISFAAAAAIIWFIVILPLQQAHLKIDAYAEQIAGLVSSLESANNTLPTLPEPKSFVPQKTDEKNLYLEPLRARLNIFTASVIVPISLKPIFKDEVVHRFNAVAENKDFQATLQNANTSLLYAHDLLNYQIATMSAIANILEYNADNDTTGGDNSILLNRMAAAKDGLSKTLAKLGALPKYDDPQLAEVTEGIKQLEEVREAYATALQAGHADTERTRYISSVSSLQQTIVANRQQFWVEKQRTARSNLTQSAHNLQPYSRALYGKNL